MANGRHLLSVSQQNHLIDLEVKKANTPKLLTASDKRQIQAYYSMINYLSSMHSGLTITAYRNFKRASCRV